MCCTWYPYYVSYVFEPMHRYSVPLMMSLLCVFCAIRLCHYPAPLIFVSMFVYDVPIMTNLLYPSLLVAMGVLN